MNKILLRKEFKANRDALSSEFRAQAAEKIRHRIMDSDLYHMAKSIMCFISFASEPDTHAFIAQAIEDGKELLVPVPNPETKEMRVSLLQNMNELTPGYYHILEPRPEFLRFQNPEVIDLVITPGLAFNRDGFRLGYGGGYYDRFFSNLSEKAIKIGICFDMQLSEKVPVHTFDRPVDWIITESETIRCKR